MLNLEEIKARAAAAAPATWPLRIVGSGESWRICGPNGTYGQACRDSEFAMSARADVLALVAEVERLQSALEREMERQFRVGVVLAESGCDCGCGHHYDDHDDDCERCLGCRVEAAMRSRP
jgi:hypothetical protein